MCEAVISKKEKQHIIVLMGKQQPAVSKKLNIAIKKAYSKRETR